MAKPNSKGEPAAASSNAPAVAVLWTLQARGDAWTGQLRDLGDAGWEFLLLRNGGHAFSRRFPSYDAAASEAEHQRQLVAREFRSE